VEPPEPVAAIATRKAGRPPKISRAAIAAAAHEIGLQDLTLRSVAAHLGVSIPALYHHVRGKDDLLALAAEHALASRSRPTDRGQHWARWLLEWAIHNRLSFVADPGLFEQYLDGGISVDTIVDNQEDVLEVLVRQGFSPREAMSSFQLVTSLALGWAVHDVRERRAAESGRTRLTDLPGILAGRGPGELPNLRRLVAEGGRPLLPTFRDHVSDLLVGLALRRGDDVAEVAAALAEV
jgi:AcrR family transcriptional regulator